MVPLKSSSRLVKHSHGLGTPQVVFSTCKAQPRVWYPSGRIPACKALPSLSPLSAALPLSRSAGFGWPCGAPLPGFGFGGGGPPPFGLPVRAPVRSCPVSGRAFTNKGLSVNVSGRHAPNWQSQAAAPRSGRRRPLYIVFSVTAVHNKGMRQLRLVGPFGTCSTPACKAQGTFKAATPQIGTFKAATPRIGSTHH